MLDCTQEGLGTPEATLMGERPLPSSRWRSQRPWLGFRFRSTPLRDSWHTWCWPCSNGDADGPCVAATLCDLGNGWQTTSRHEL